MNLYLFNDNDRASTFGIGTYLQELTNALEDSSIHVHIIHLHSDRKEFETVITNQVEHWYIPEVQNNNTFSGSVQKVESYLQNVIYLLLLHIKDAEDLVFHFNYNTCWLLAKELKAKFNCTTVTTVHYLKWALYFQGNLQKLHAIKLKFKNQRNQLEQFIYKNDEYERQLFKETDHLIALSHDMKNSLCSEYQIAPKKIIVISNGLSDMISIPQNNNDVLRRKWGLAEKELLILFAGRLDPDKGVLFLIRAFHKVLEVIPNCRLMIAGSGEYDIYFRESKNICSKITFTGLLGKKELHELYQIADIGVIPSLYEPFGYVSVEMMMHRLPIIAVATAGLDEVVDEKCGIKIPVIEYSDKVEIDTNLLADKIIYLLEHREEANQLGNNARKRYEERYSKNIFRENMLNFYLSIYSSK